MFRSRIQVLIIASLAAVSGMAAWAIWKAHPFARGWTIAASLLYLSVFMRPFLILIRPVRDHNLVSLVVGLVGVAAFAWPTETTRYPTHTTPPENERRTSPVIRLARS